MSINRFVLRPKGEHAGHVRRGGAQTSPNLYRVSDQAVTMTEIAVRCGCTVRQARQRLQRERTKGPVTWEGLKT